jgi:CheY-like chemotaxis protein
MQILLFEDHDRLASSIVKGLADFGFGVDSFASAADGLSAMKAIAYDGVILDLGLPDRDGIDVLRELRKGDTRTPILILTARDGIDDRVAGLDSGADDYVLKPFAMKSWRRACGRSCDGRGERWVRRSRPATCGSTWRRDRRPSTIPSLASRAGDRRIGVVDASGRASGLEGCD